jgi:hypothetical protein
MDFNQLVIDEIFPILSAYDFSISENFHNVLRFKSTEVGLSISYDQIDRTGLIEAGKRDGFLYPLDDELVKNVFGSSIKIEQTNMDVFVHNVALFLKTDGSSILTGDRIKMEQIKEFVERESEVYTSKLVQEQTLMQVDKAWSAGQYPEVVRLMDELKNQDLPQSYQLKYKIALQRR